MNRFSVTRYIASLAIVGTAATIHAAMPCRAVQPATSVLHSNPVVATAAPRPRPPRIDTAISVQPNPAREIVSIRLEGSVEAWRTLRIYDGLGQLVADLSGKLPPGLENAPVTISFDTGNFMAGCYFVTAESEKGRAQIPVTIIR